MRIWICKGFFWIQTTIFFRIRQNYKFKREGIISSRVLNVQDSHVPKDFIYYITTYMQGQGNDFFLGGARLIRKMKFWQFSKILLYKSWIQGGPAGPTPLHIWYLPYVKALT